MAPAERMTSLDAKYCRLCPNLSTSIPLAMLVSSRITLEALEYVMTSTFCLYPQSYGEFRKKENGSTNSLVLAFNSIRFQAHPCTFGVPHELGFQIWIPLV